MTLSAWNTIDELKAFGYDVQPTRYVDRAHGIDWAIINWFCPACHDFRWAPGPGEPPMDEHGAFAPVLPGVNVPDYSNHR